MGKYAYGDTRLDFAYGNIPRMHTVSDWNIPVCIRGLHKSPYAYGDYVSCDSRMHTGISTISVCIRGLILIPVCLRGLHDMQSPYAYGDWTWSPYAYGDFMFWTWRVHVVNSQNSDSLHDACKNSDSMRDSRKDCWRQKLIPVRIRGVPICERVGIQKNSHMGSPRTHNEIVRIWGLTYIVGTQTHKLPIPVQGSAVPVLVPVLVQAAPYSIIH
jgi:hypothetical protein